MSVKKSAATKATAPRRDIDDGLANVLTGLGGRADKSSTNFYTYMPLHPMQLASAYRGNWLVRKIVDVPAEDEVAEWRAWQAEDDEIEAIEAEERRLNFAQKVCEARKRARLYGGAALWIVTQDANDLANPLVPEQVGVEGIRALVVLGRDDLNIGPFDPSRFPEMVPLYYSVKTADNNEIIIHPSRIVIFRGVENLMPRTASDPKDIIFGDSTLFSIDDTVKQALGTAQGIFAMVQEAKVDVYKIPQFTEQLMTAEGERLLMARVKGADMLKSVANSLVIDATEEWEAKQVSFATLPDVLDRFLQIVAGAADIPVTRLLGQSPAGMNSTGESDLQNYWRRIASGQSLDLGPTLSFLDDCLINSALGSRPDSIHYNWRTLEKVSDLDRANIANIKANAIATYAGLGLIPDEALARSVVNMITEDGLLPGLEGEVEEAGGIEGAPVFEEPSEEEQLALNPALDNNA